jgi:hypothetical protein
MAPKSVFIKNKTFVLSGAIYQSTVELVFNDGEHSSNHEVEAEFNL